MEVKKIMLVDDHEIFRNGVRQLIDKEVDMEVIAEAGSGYEAVQKAEQYKPDVILMDISMPQFSGLDASQELLRKNPETRILFLSLYDREDYILKAVNMGASGYILKDESNKDFLKAIRKIAEGKYYFSGDTSDVILNSIRKGAIQQHITKSRNTSEEFHLSRRETEILVQIAGGLNNKSISEKFNVSIRTIETHRLNIMRKFRVNTIEQAILTAKSEGLIAD